MARKFKYLLNDATFTFVKQSGETFTVIFTHSGQDERGPTYSAKVYQQMELDRKYLMGFNVSGRQVINRKYAADLVEQTETEP